jgi:erythronate-4-phosphate dehydrogenase
MKTVCCANMPFAEDAFSTLGEVVLLDGRAIAAADVRDADLLAIRSTTKVNASLLEGSPVRFVGTATIGIDHLDTAYLDSHGIRWCYSPGCNANSVAEYLVSALLCLARRHGFALEGRTLGVIGVGNVGRRVVEKAHALGLRVLQNDPPRQRNEPDQAASFVDLATLLAESDIVTVHVPLTREGRDATWHMVDTAFLGRMRDGAIFVNAARGPVMDTAALLAAMESGRVGHAVIDTWEGEPGFHPALLARADIGTPHIAGYSFEGKVGGTVMVYEEACRFLDVAPAWTVERHMPPPPVPQLRIEGAGCVRHYR